MKVLTLYSLLLCCLGPARALFIPEELPTLLSFLYTNIPPIFKGTDSRLGVGFRVGPNADFQVQVELGPQTRTQPAGPDAEGTSKKRHVPNHHLDDLQGPLPSRHRVKVPPQRPDTPLGWLQSWKSSVGSLAEEEQESGPALQPAMDIDTVMHLRQLYQPSDGRDNGVE